MENSKTYPQLMERLEEVRRQWRSRLRIEGLLLALGIGLTAMMAAIALDNGFRADGPWRWFLGCAVWLSWLALAWFMVFHRWLEDRRDDFFALLVERKHPELRNQLINGLQLGRARANGFSEGLVEAIVDDATRVTANLDLTGSVDGRTLRRVGCLALTAVVVAVVYAAYSPERFTNGMARVLLPTASIPAYTATRVVESSVRPGDVRVPEGTNVVVESRVEGTVPSSAHLIRRIARDGKQSAPQGSDLGEGNLFRFSAMPALESFDYQIVAGDGLSRYFHVEVVKRPQLEKLTVNLHAPVYTALAERRQDDSDGEISDLPGTRVVMLFKASKALKEGSLLTQEGISIPLEKKGNDDLWGCSFILGDRVVKKFPSFDIPVVQAPTRYQVRLLDSDGYENADPLWRSLSLVRDQAPMVTITEPGQDLQVKPKEEIALTVETRDDYGLGAVKVVYQVNEEAIPHELGSFDHPGPPVTQTKDRFTWNLASKGLKAGDVVKYWAVATDRNDITGPGRGESRHFSLFLVSPEQAVAKLDVQIQDYVQALEELVRRQRENRAQTASGSGFEILVSRQALIRDKTQQLARLMEKDALPVVTVVKSLDELYAGLLARAVNVLERGRDARDAAQAADLRAQSLPVQDQIVRELEALLARLQRNEQAKEALRKLEKKDKAAHQAVSKTLNQMVKDLDRLLKDQTEVASKFEKLPKKNADEPKEEKLKGIKDLEEMAKKWEKWAKGMVNELTKLPAGFVDDFQLRPDVNKIFEEIEKAAARSKAEKIEVSLEDLGAALATKMKEDLEMWMPDSPDAAKWVLEEPLDKKTMKIPEMPLPKALEDLVGDLVQKAEEFDEDADDITSAWGDNLDQAGWGVADGPISTFSAKGKTGNDLPNNMEVSGRSGEGRRGKSSGQMVGDTVKGLGGRKTPARVGAEKYEPGQLKTEGQEDPNGATGGGKKAGAGRKGLQGGTPPDFVRDMGRLGAKQAGVREKAEQVARKLDQVGITSKRLTESIELMKSVEKDFRDLRYEDAARRRRVALGKLKSAVHEMDQTSAAELSRARDLPPQLRKELLQGMEEGYPAGYESLLKNYFKALSTAEK